MRVGIVGYGLAGRVIHGRLLAGTPGVEVVGAVTRSRAADLVADFPAARSYDSTPDLLSGAKPDLLVVASPNSDHVPSALAGIRAGVPVVVDKPLAPTASQALDLVAAAAGAGVPLTVFQNRRWDADHLTVSRLVRDGVLGPVHRYESRFERWRPSLEPGWRQRAGEPGGGVLLDLGAHLVDQAVQLFGPVSSSYGEVRTLRGGNDDDVFLALTHASGTISHLWAGALTAAPGPRLRVLGAQAALVVDDLDGQEASLRDGAPVRPQTARLQQGDDVTPYRLDKGGWPDFYALVRDALTEGGPLPVDPHDAVDVLRILESAAHSNG